jgi:hypothetical protein
MDIEEIRYQGVGFDVLMAVIMKMAVFWVVTSCSRFIDVAEAVAASLFIFLMMEAVRTCETSISLPDYAALQSFSRCDCARSVFI